MYIIRFCYLKLQPILITSERLDTELGQAIYTNMPNRPLGEKKEYLSIYWKKSGMYRDPCSEEKYGRFLKMWNPQVTIGLNMNSLCFKSWSSSMTTG